MHLQLSQDQAEALYYLFLQHVLPEKPADVAESLIHDFMFDIYKKSRSKLEARKLSKGYSINITDKEAKAYYIYFQNRSLGAGFIYEQTMIERHLAEIDKKHA
ncbi:MAG: hypothetical protein ACXVAY_01555 [Mucilaginibacter sp.]